ncbi:hypothetical protein SHIRM173S_11030 [Streptomyces hirsutus]
MYASARPALSIAAAGPGGLRRRGGRYEVRCSPPPARPSSPSTTPVTRYAPGWPSPPTRPGDGPGERYATTSPAPGFDTVVAVVDSAADTPALHAPGGLPAELAAHTPQVLLAVVPSYVPAPSDDVPARTGRPCCPGRPERPAPMLPEPLRGPAFSSYAPEEVGWLLKDLSDVTLEAADRGARGGHPERRRALRRVAARRVPAERALPGTVPRGPADLGGPPRPRGRRGHRDRARREIPAPGTRLAGPGRHPRRHPDAPLGPAPPPADLPHYAVSIVRGRGIDANALRWLAAHHDPRDVVFVDGWTGKGAITRELAQAVEEFEKTHGVTGFDPEIAVLADPGSLRADVRHPRGLPDSVRLPQLDRLRPHFAHRAPRRPGRSGRLPRRQVLPRTRRSGRLGGLPGRRLRPLPRGRRTPPAPRPRNCSPPTAPPPGRAGPRSNASVRSTGSTT